MKKTEGFTVQNSIIGVLVCNVRVLNRKFGVLNRKFDAQNGIIGVLFCDVDVQNSMIGVLGCNGRATTGDRPPISFADELFYVEQRQI